MDFNSDWPLKWYPVAAIVTLALVLFVVIVTETGGDSILGRMGGDFQSFYGAGTIVLEGDLDQLYDEDRQYVAQLPLHTNNGTYLCFAYPPFVVLPYAFLALFPYNVAYLINTCVLVLVLVAVLKIIFEKLAISNKYFLLAFVISLFFYPIFKSVFGGQNTLYTLLFLCLCWRYTDKNQELLAGICLGLMLFKPQFALPMIGLMALVGRWKVVGAATATGLALYLVSSALLGFDWFAEWWEFATWFTMKDSLVNGVLSVSWADSFVGVLGPGARVFGLVLSVIHVCLLSFFWLNYRNVKSISRLIPITCSSLTLIPPRVIYYDSGLILLACFMLAVDKDGPGRKALIVIWLGAYLQAFALPLGFSPMAFINVCVLALSILYFYKYNQGDNSFEKVSR